MIHIACLRVAGLLSYQNVFLSAPQGPPIACVVFEWWVEVFPIIVGGIFIALRSMVKKINKISKQTTENSKKKSFPSSLFTVKKALVVNET